MFNRQFRQKAFSAGIKDYYGYSRPEMLKFVPPDARKILEVGCAEGRFGFLLKRSRPAEIWGIEPIAAVAEKAKENLDRVITGDIESDFLDLPTAYFDCIVFNDVLEHLKNPWAVLEKVRQNMKTGGVVVASIPNVRYFKTVGALLFKGKWEYTDAGILDRTHLRFFTFASAADLFARTGYRVELIEGISTFSWKFKLLNGVFFNSLTDMGHAQIVCVARKSET